MAYAKGTTISPEKSRIEIEQVLKKYGATGFAYAEQNNRAMIAFAIKGSDKSITLMVRMTLPLPEPGQVVRNKNGHALGKSQSAAAIDAMLRERWRSMLLVVKAKLEACHSGISTIEREFLPDVVNPATNRTVGETVFPALTAAYQNPDRPALPLLGS